MSGIMGYVGKRQAPDVLIECLSRLDYRGYDSAGIATVDNGQIQIRKQVGRIDDLVSVLAKEPIKGQIGIGHTRWATHGLPTWANSHPLTDCRSQFAIVHNGIINNYQALTEGLMERGHVFKTETDTEVIAHLLEEEYAGDLPEAVRKVLARIDGSYALAVISSRHPDMIVAACQDNPLVIGMGEGEYFLASDVPAFGFYTKTYDILYSGEMAVLSARKPLIYMADGQTRQPLFRQADWADEETEKGVYPHYMLKEIMEQPQAIRRTLQERLTENGVHLPELDALIAQLSEIQRIEIVACGTSYHAAQIGRHLIAGHCGLFVESAVASEYRYANHRLGQGTLVVILSQSGETADSIAALREAKRQNKTVVAITNTRGSTIAREADFTLYTGAGPELAVASTKAFTTQLTMLALLTIWLLQHHPGATIDEADADISGLMSALHRLPEDVESTLVMVQDAMDEYAALIYDQEHMFLIGRGLDHVIAFEGSLKIQEVAYIHSDAYRAGELKHGTLSLITSGVPVIAMVTQPHLREKMFNNIKEVKARHALVMAITTIGEEHLDDVVDQVLYIPRTHPSLQPILAVIPLQLLAYYAGVFRGHDVDKPRHLAKSVTVE